MTVDKKSKCFHCSDISKVRVRDVSTESWEILLAFGEVERSEVNMPICDTCYSELREVMIDRREEVQALLSKKTKKKQKLAS